MSRPALKLVPAFRSRLEKKVADQLTAAGIEYGYETRTVQFAVPSRTARYTPDFDCGPILIEAKGRFGHRGSDADGAKVRQHLALVHEQHPELDIRIIFQDAQKPIYRGSKTTYVKWADDHGFRWSDKGLVPYAWIKELRKQDEGASVDTPGANRTASSRKARKNFLGKGRSGLRNCAARRAHL